MGERRIRAIIRTRRGHDTHERDYATVGYGGSGHPGHDAIARVIAVARWHGTPTPCRSRQSMVEGRGKDGRPTAQIP
jgi:hypothetical protein